MRPVGRINSTNTAPSSASDTRQPVALHPVHLPSNVKKILISLNKKHGNTLFDNANLEGISDEDLTVTNTRSPPSVTTPLTQGPSSSSNATTTTNNNNRSGSKTKSSANSMVDVLKTHQMLHFQSQTLTSRNSMRQSLMEFHASLTLAELAELNDRLERKIETIVEQVTRKYQKKKDELDALGIFHAQANDSRVQTLCGMEILKKLKVDQLREQTIIEMQDEVLGYVLVSEYI